MTATEDKTIFTNLRASIFMSNFTSLKCKFKDQAEDQLK